MIQNKIRTNLSSFFPTTDVVDHKCGTSVQEVNKYEMYQRQKGKKDKREGKTQKRYHCTSQWQEGQRDFCDTAISVNVSLVTCKDNREDVQLQEIGNFSTTNIKIT